MGAPSVSVFTLDASDSDCGGFLKNFRRSKSCRKKAGTKQKKERTNASEFYAFGISFSPVELIAWGVSISKIRARAKSTPIDSRDTVGRIDYDYWFSRQPTAKMDLIPMLYRQRDFKAPLWAIERRLKK
jgi:hypothetical protein